MVHSQVPYLLDQISWLLVLFVWYLFESDDLYLRAVFINVSCCQREKQSIVTKYLSLIHCKKCFNHNHSIQGSIYGGEGGGAGEVGNIYYLGALITYVNSIPLN